MKRTTLAVVDLGSNATRLQIASVDPKGRTTVLAEDRGDHVVLRPVPDDPVAAAVGTFATQIGVLGSEEVKHLDCEEELDVQERR